MVPVYLEPAQLKLRARLAMLRVLGRSCWGSQVGHLATCGYQISSLPMNGAWRTSWRITDENP
eukprot:8310340-Alexandrium_andersonii.AAC.1